MAEEQSSGKAGAPAADARAADARADDPSARQLLVPEPQYPIEITATREELEALRTKLRRTR